MSRWTVRQATRADLPLMAELERSGDQAFLNSDRPQFGTADPTPSDQLEPYVDAGSAWIAEDAGHAGGFVVAGPRDDQFIIFQISVALEHQGTGAGGVLMRAALEAGRRLGCRQAALTTFRDIAWNAPWYRRFGFEIAPEADLSPALAHLRDKEAALGFDMSQRCAMTVDLRA